MEIARGQKGQAAVTDALYFLTIVTALCVFMFAFSNQYGTSVSKQIARQYSTDYATSALKTILYSSTPRDPRDSLYGSDVEIDHLLAYIKEDYADDENLSVETMLVLADNVKSIIRPKADAYDYLFYIHIPTERKFVYVFFHFTNFKTTGCPGSTRQFTAYCADDPPHIDYFCGTTASGENSIDREIISDLIAKVGDTAQSSAKIKLVREVEDGFRDFKAEASLIMWTATFVGTRFFYEADPWNCVEVP